jgi:hypothetical protein
MMYRGIMMTSLGIIRVPINMIKMTSLPLNLNLDKPYAARLLRINCNTVTEPATKRVFNRRRVKGIRLKAPS